MGPPQAPSRVSLPEGVAAFLLASFFLAAKAQGSLREALVEGGPVTQNLGPVTSIRFQPISI